MCMLSNGFNNLHWPLCALHTIVSGISFVYLPSFPLSPSCLFFASITLLWIFLFVWAFKKSLFSNFLTLPYSSRVWFGHFAFASTCFLLPSAVALILVVSMLLFSSFYMCWPMKCCSYFHFSYVLVCQWLFGHI